LESNWRFNVWLVGQSHTVYDLCARRTDDPRYWVFGDMRFRDAYYLGLKQFGDTQFVVPGPVTLLPGPEPFPFGFPVEPDNVPT